jgi:hypothetical protein
VVEIEKVVGEGRAISRRGSVRVGSDCAAVMRIVGRGVVVRVGWAVVSGGLTGVGLRREWLSWR